MSSPAAWFLTRAPIQHPSSKDVEAPEATNGWFFSVTEEDNTGAMQEAYTHPFFPKLNGKL